MRLWQRWGYRSAFCPCLDDELIERTAVIEAMGQVHREFEIRDIQCEMVGNARNRDFIPLSPDEQQWRYARSNGVAVGSDWEDATCRAGLELTERDRIPTLLVRRISLPRRLNCHPACCLGH